MSKNKRNRKFAQSDDAIQRLQKLRHHQANVDRIWQEFDPEALRRICEMPEADFARAYGMDTQAVPLQPSPSNFYYSKDNGSNVLAVAHLDTVVEPYARRCGFLNTADGLVVYSGALDDRLGAYIILDLLPRLDINVDLLLTVGEEQGQSTAAFFDPPKEYNWMIEFDRGGTDVVMYQYDDDGTAGLVRDTGARVGQGIFSDICYLEHLGIKGFNWGVGYQDYHSPRSHAFLDDTFKMLGHFMDFHTVNADTHLLHVEADPRPWWTVQECAEDDAAQAEISSWGLPR